MFQIGVRSPEIDRKPIRPPSLIRFLAINAGIGAAVAILVVAALILSDSHQLGRLIRGDESPILAIIMLVFGFIITFGSAAMGAAIMGLPYGDGNGRSGRRSVARPAADGTPVPARVVAPARR